MLDRNGGWIHPSVDLTPTATGFELRDGRTDFRLAIDDLAIPDRRGPLAGELLSLFDELGLLKGDLSEQEIRLRQQRFRDEQAWEERLERLRALLSFAVDKVAYYRLRRREYDPARLSSRDGLKCIPILRKADVRAAFMELCADGVDVRSEIEKGHLELVATSGTTEDRLQVLSDTRLVRIPSSYDEIFAIPRHEKPPRTAVFTSAMCMTQQCTLTSSDIASRVVHDHTLYLPTIRDPFSLDRDTVQRIVDEMNTFRPEFLFVNPVYAHLLGRHARQFGIRLPPVELVLSCYQYLSRVQRRALTTYFNAPVRNLYAATELGGCQLGLECNRGRLHLREDHCLVEVLTPDGDARLGEPGAIVVSTLAGTTMPLIRYAVGDLAAVRGYVCDCPLSDWPTIDFHGREREALFLNGRWFTTRMLDDLIGDDIGIDFYCCRQVRDATLVLEVVPSLEAAFLPESLKERFAQAMPGVSVEVTRVKEITPAPSLKYPLTVREISAPPFLPQE